jgi:hypothetical protein
MIWQNIASRENERLHELDLQINLLNDCDMTAMLRLVGIIAEKLKICEAEQAEALGFAHNSDPRALLDQIVAAERAARRAQPTDPNRGSNEK